MSKEPCNEEQACHDTGACSSTGVCQAIAFLGETLAPFFLQDPLTGSAGASFDAFAALDTDAAAEAWPFVEPSEAREALALMVGGLHGQASTAAASKTAGEVTGEAASVTTSVTANNPLGDLAAEYRRLFVGPGHKETPPWGSVYTDKDCVVFGLTTLELRRWMREHGIARTTNDRTPEDHIGLMLALMGQLALNKPAVLADYLQTQLLTWAPHFLDEMEQAARHPFYQGLARLTRASLAGIRDELDIDVTEPRFYR